MLRELMLLLLVLLLQTMQPCALLPHNREHRGILLLTGRSRQSGRW